MQFKHVSLFILMISLVFIVSGCGLSSGKAVSQIEDYLEDKYNKEFTVSAIGNRMYRDTATSIVYANDDPSMQFIVIINSEGKVVYDQYTFRRVCRKVEDEINESFEKAGIKSECFIDFNKWVYDLSVDCSIEDYIFSSSADTIAAAIICENKNQISVEELSEICSTISSEISDITIASSIYLLTESDFSKVQNTVRTGTKYFDTDILKLYGAVDTISKVRIKTLNGILDASSVEIDAGLAAGDIN